MRIAFNHAYYLRHDLTRTWILSRPGRFNRVHSTWTSIIHPVYAMILSFFDKPIEKGEAIALISHFFGIPEESASKLINPFIESDGAKSAIYEGHTNYFPEDILLTDNFIHENNLDTNYSPEQFAYRKLDFDNQRFHTAPQSVVWMVNNQCATSCVYCYADKKTRYFPMTMEHIKKMICSIKSMGIEELSLIGGEVLIHPNWKEILELLKNNHFFIGLISTKIPLDKESLLYLKQHGVRLQFSLDSLDADIASKTLQVKPDYLTKIKKSIKLADKLGLSYQIATVLTKFNSDLSTINELHKFISELRNPIRWEIRQAFPSLYSMDFNSFKCNESTTELLNQWIQGIPDEERKIIMISPPNAKKYRTAEGGASNFQGSRCSANSTNMVILPDGKVTICEQLYWNPRFIIGDILKQSIPEIWNSPRALELANYPQDKVQTNSACAKCEIYEKCRQASNQCYADILKAYGDENWDYPDPRCAKANDFLRPFISTD